MANSFTVLTTKPTSKDPYIYLYNNASNNGKSRCIKGSPVDKDCNVLCNCVGWACGRFNHIYNILTGYNGIKYSNFCCNAEKFIEVAQGYGMTISQTPQPGAIMVWQKGNTLNGSDGAGHVAIVEKVISSTQVMTSESGYGNFAFANKTRNKGTGNWGAGSSYKFRGFILNPAVNSSTTSTGGTSTTTSTVSNAPSPVSRNTSANQLKIKITNLRIRKTPSLSGVTISNAKVGYYNYTSSKNADGYTWYMIGTDAWVAYKSDWIDLLPASTTSATESSSFKVGDTVKLNSDATVYGTTTKFSSWVYNSTLYVRQIDGDRIVVSTFKSGAITGAVKSNQITKI